MTGDPRPPEETRAGGPPVVEGGRRRLGVLGTMVWDTIRSPEREGALEAWGGISYGIAAAAAAAGPAWEIVPLTKIGRDLGPQALAFLRGIPRVDWETGIQVVPEPTNRVELRYDTPTHRTERLRGGVPPWGWSELAPLVRGCDALYVNFISGFELDLDSARALRAGFEGPIFADLHSLFLGLGQGGLRVPRVPPEAEDWLRCFDAVQMNEIEFSLLGAEMVDPWSFVAGVLGPEVGLVAVTTGGRGAVYLAGSGFSPNPERWRERRHLRTATSSTERVAVPVPTGAEQGDPTGCGDVWGATAFSELLSGAPLDRAITSANRMAALNVLHSGARGLYDHLVRARDEP